MLFKNFFRDGRVIFAAYANDNAAAFELFYPLLQTGECFTRPQVS